MVNIEDAPRFVAKDFMGALGWTYQNLKYHCTNNLSASERGQTQLATLGGKQRMSIISESGLYKLIMRSDKPEARAFQDWVTKVVPPAIRKDGGYVMGEDSGIRIK